MGGLAKAEVGEFREGDPLWGARLKTFYFNAIAAAEDYRALKLSVRLPRGVHDTPLYVGVISPESIKLWFGVSDVPRGAIGVTLTTVRTVLGRDLIEWERQMVFTNMGGQEWAVAAMILGLNSIDQCVRMAITDAGWQGVKLEDWRVVFADAMVAMRRCPFIEGLGWAEPHAYCLRKIFNCSARNSDDADFADEVEKMTVKLPVHVWVGADGIGRRSAWRPRLASSMRRVLTTAVGQMLEAHEPESMADWWASRWAWAPGGSTSERYRLSAAIGADERLDGKDRAGKKAVFEALGPSHVGDILAGGSVVLGRTSTKHEPGGKNRALYAEGDRSFIVSSYASLHLEKHMNVGGMVGKQTPADVCAWFARSHISPISHPYWLSADYADFNKGHEAEDLALLDMTLGGIWAQSRASPCVRADKVRCALWTAKTHLNKWAVIKGTLVKIFGSLFSGSRNTARDNTLLHKSYSDLAIEAMVEQGWEGRLGAQAYCGDDEDVEFSDWNSSLWYYVMHRQMGHELKPSKQLAGETHEFLQRMVVPGQHTIRPLFAMLAQACSGNWYADNHIWYGNAIAAVTDNTWEMHVRGMPLEWARKLTVETLNATMRVPMDSGGWQRLEWWTYRNGAGGTHPLWHGLGEDHDAAPEVTPKVTPVAGVPHMATEAWVDKMESILGKLKKSKRTDLLATCAADSYSKLYVRERLRQQRFEVLHEWPERTSSVPLADFHIGLITPPSVASIVTQVLAEPVDRRPTSEDEVASRFGVNAAAISAAGGWCNVLENVRPELCARYERPVAAMRIPPEYRKMDSALVTWATLNRRFEVYESGMPVGSNSGRSATQGQVGTRQLCWYAAGNGMGKSTFVKRAKAAGRVVLDVDALLGEYPQLRTCLSGDRDALVKRGTEQFAAAIMDACARYAAQSVVWQGDCCACIKQLRQWGWTVNVVVVELPPLVVAGRLRSRWWTEDKIMRRQAGWKRVMATVLEQEKNNNVQISRTF